MLCSKSYLIIFTRVLLFEYRTDSEYTLRSFTSNFTVCDTLHTILCTRFLVMQIFDEKMCSRLKIIGSIEKRFILKPPCNLSKSAFIRFNLLDTFWNPFQIFPNSERIKIRIFLKSKSRSCFLKSPVLQHEELRTFRLVGLFTNPYPTYPSYQP